MVQVCPLNRWTGLSLTPAYRLQAPGSCCLILLFHNTFLVERQNFASSLKKTIFRATSLQTRQLSLGDTSGLVRRQALLKCSLGFPFWFTEVTNKKILIYWALWQNWEKLSLAWSCLSVRPHGTARLPPDGFSWNLIFEDYLEVKLKFH